MQNQPQIFVQGLNLKSVESDKKLEEFFNELNDKIVRIADKKLVSLCKKFDIDAKLNVIIVFEEEKK